MLVQAAGAACTGTAAAVSSHAAQLPRPKTTEARKSNAASYAVQAEVSPCTAHGERASWPCRVKGSLRCATPLRALDPMGRRALATQKDSG